MQFAPPSPATSLIVASTARAMGAVLALAVLAVYAASPVRTSFDSRWTVHTAMSLVRGHGGDLSAYGRLIEANGGYAIQNVGGGLRTLYPAGVSILIAPVVLATAWLDPAFETRMTERIPTRFEQVLASVIGAGSVLLFFCLLLVQFHAPATALAGSIAFALGTSMWSTASRALWQHGPMVLFLTAAMILLVRGRARPSLVPYAALPLAIAYMMRPTAALPVAVLSAYVLLAHRAQAMRYFGWAALAGVPWLAFNMLTLGRLLPAYYLIASGEGPSSMLGGLAGLLFSPARGLFVYSPMTLLALVGCGLAWRDRPARPLHAAFGLVVVLHIMVVAQWPIWWGGHCYGPRLLTDLLPILGFYAACAIHAALRTKSPAGLAACAALVLASIAMHAPGALENRALEWNVKPDNVDTDTSRLWDWRDPPFLAGLRRG